MISVTSLEKGHVGSPHQQVGSLLRKVVHAAMHVGVHVQVLVAHGIKHTKGLLRGCRIIQIDQGFSIYFPLQYGEVFAYIIYYTSLFNFACKNTNKRRKQCAICK